MKSKDAHTRSSLDDTPRTSQASHRDTQNRTKKEGHATQIGTGQDQQSQRNRGAGARSKS
ncbi:hypothetical protein [Achromobacter ruhlandii]|uniref:Uncharacterized protein n=1 Tax=Achromobacter ruhlandii TaxID=72557 RepID=A0ABM8M1F2_9BURK|nr:hypothetical protein [Achromobacter ruhlandii]AKP90552.1 hypothetical protein Axylo_3063 [Achromobacter xylosoxidans]AOU93791.1 uncharacterized protein AruCF_2900 [Achromobacter ruhlandii]MCZ8432921.1 hypothetical protein [Achromobacter ruhlandii]MDC6092499.1 hypothetical protein [Achromobacter ruhlandii]MDC6152075.1 hypothetical protein [Achromobacter ruhlandii]